MNQDHYATLGVMPTAKTAEIRAAYLALMRENHPDRNASPEATLRAQAIIAAFKVLGDFDRRNHYDWDRRRAREAEAAAAARRPRRIRAGAIAAGAIGLAAVGAWVMMRGPAPEPVSSAPKVEVQPLPEVKRVAVASPAKTKVAQGVPIAKAEPAPKPVRIAKSEPVRVPVRPEPKVERAPVVRVAAIKAPTQRVMPATAPRPPAKAAAKPVQPASKPATDLASLDQFVMNFYGQSWRYGDAPKRAALVQSRDNFVARRGACTAEACKRAAYLRLMRDVSEIVETGQPKTR